MVKVSVIVPVYKVEKYIAATVESVLQQTYKDFELLIIDDDSPDKSIEICQQFTDPRIKIIHQQNRGLAGARNTGIRNAKGEYFAFLDADDLWLPEKLAKHITHLENAPDVGISYSSSAFIDESGNSLGIYQVPKLKNITPSLVLCRNPIGNGSAAVIRRKVFEAIKFQDNLYGKIEGFYFDEQFRESEDVECWMRMAILTDWQFEGIAEALTLYRVNSGGLSANLIKKLDSWKQLIEKIRSYAPELITQCENPTMAYQLRFLARRAVTLKDGSMAVQLAHQALTTHWGILFEEPRRTLLTLAAAYSLWLLPHSIHAQIESFALKITGFTQKRRIIQQQSRQSV